MTRADALRALLAKVEAGEAEFDWTADYWPRDDGFWLPAHSCQGAYAGSLDAAKALHEAVLPGWVVDDLSVNGRLAGHPWGIRIERWDASNPGCNEAVSAGWGLDDLPGDIPARDWLAAILKALIATEDN